MPMSTAFQDRIDTEPYATFGHALPSLPSAPDARELLQQLLAEQQQLTAVEQFAREHANGAIPAQAKYYSKLLPATPPGPGQQYAFDVDLDRCSGCKACVTACHALNGLDEHETWRDVGLLVGGTTALPVLQHVTTACHHCLEPACMTGCPVDAYEKDPVTGIVRHLDDQCFGCQYCTLACPYDVPKYHAGKGIVRKCDMCSQRLAVGEAPACVQACPHEAIAIKVVDVRQVVEDAEANLFLPGAPEPHITLPTTTYRTKRVFPRNMLPADYYAVSPQHPHWPLIVMLVLTQLSVGAFLIHLLLETLLSADAAAALRPIQTTSALGFGLLALAASTLHLGRPQYAYRAVIGLAALVAQSRDCRFRTVRRRRPALRRGDMVRRTLAVGGRHVEVDRRGDGTGRCVLFGDDLCLRETRTLEPEWHADQVRPDVAAARRRQHVAGVVARPSHRRVRQLSRTC